MDPQNLPLITSAVAPVVMVSAAGLLFLGIQTKNLHLADRIRALVLEYRTLETTPGEPARREQIVEQLRLFDKRIRLSQHALELLYLAILCFVVTSLLLASAAWLADWALTVAIPAIFVSGVGVLLTALIIEFLEMRVGLRTIGIEIEGALGSTRAKGAR